MMIQATERFSRKLVPTNSPPTSGSLEAFLPAPIISMLPCSYFIRVLTFPILPILKPTRCIHTCHQRHSLPWSWKPWLVAASRWSLHRSICAKIAASYCKQHLGVARTNFPVRKRVYSCMSSMLLVLHSDGRRTWKACDGGCQCIPALGFQKSPRRNTWKDLASTSFGGIEKITCDVGRC